MTELIHRLENGAYVRVSVYDSPEGPCMEVYTFRLEGPVQAHGDVELLEGEEPTFNGRTYTFPNPVLRHEVAHNAYVAGLSKHGQLFTNWWAENDARLFGKDAEEVIRMFECEVPHPMSLK